MFLRWNAAEIRAYARALHFQGSTAAALLVPETDQVITNPPVSRGTWTVAYLLMRIGLAQHMSAIGESVPLVLDVEPGKHRELDPEEVSALRANAEGKYKPRRVKSTNLLPKDAGMPAEQRAARAKGRGGKPFRPRTERPESPGRERFERRERGTGEARTRESRQRFERHEKPTGEHKPRLERREKPEFRSERPRLDRRGKPDSRTEPRPKWGAESRQDRPARKPFRTSGETSDFEPRGASRKPFSKGAGGDGPNTPG